MVVRTAAPLLLINLASVLAAQEQAHNALRGAGADQEVSRPRDPDADGSPRKGLGLQMSSFVWHEGDVSKPQGDQSADQSLWRGLGPQISSHVWQENAAGAQDGGGEVSISLQPTFGEGLGLGPQIGSRTRGAEETDESGREDGTAGIGAEVSMPLSEQDIVEMGRTVPLGPQLSTRVAPGGREFYTIWYAYTAEFLTQPNGRFFQLCLLVNVLVLAVAFYCGTPSRNGKDKQRLFRCGPRRRSAADLASH